MKLSVVFLTLGLAILANGDYTNTHWLTGLLHFPLTILGSVKMI